jgi:hypothetical protein
MKVKHTKILYCNRPTCVRRLETAEIAFVKVFAGYRMTNHKRNEDIRE